MILYAGLEQYKKEKYKKKKHRSVHRELKDIHRDIDKFIVVNEE